MDLKDMILVTENDRGTETNMLMALDDYKSFIAVDDMSELADNLLQLGRTLGEADNFAEYYRAANVTVSARFCLDDIQLGHFLQGLYNDSKEFRFDKEASSSECVAKLKEIGMTDKGWVDDFNLHYESVDRSFERGQTFHNFNDHDYMVLEALSPRNLVVMDMKSGSLTIALGATEYKRYPKDEKPTKDNTTIGVSWEHGIYLGSTLSTTNFKAYKREYGTPEKIEDIYDYRAKLKQKFYFYQDMSKDDDVPKKLQNDFLHQMYEDFGTIEEDCFYDRLEDGKYDKGWVDDFNLHYEMENRSFERGQTFHNFNDHDYMVLEALSPRNLVVMDMKSGSLTIALGATEYKRYPKDEKPTKDNTTIGVSWEHGIYLGSTLSTTNFKAYKREYGTPEKIEDIYDYRAKLKQKFYFYQDMSKDDDVPKKLQNDFLHQMYEDFGTIEEDCFYDRLEDGKYDEGFKERQVKEEKSR